MLPSRIFFDDFFGDEPSKLDKMMKCDIYEVEDKTMIEIDMPGAKKEDLTLDIEKGYLTITYTKTSEDTNEDRKYIRRERREILSAERRFYVGDINEDEIEAEFKDGILTIKVPAKSNVSTKKTININ